MVDSFPHNLNAFIFTLRWTLICGIILLSMSIHIRMISEWGNSYSSICFAFIKIDFYALILFFSSILCLCIAQSSCVFHINSSFHTCSTLKMCLVCIWSYRCVENGNCMRDIISLLLFFFLSLKKPRWKEPSIFDMLFLKWTNMCVQLKYVYVRTQTPYSTMHRT